MEYLKVWVSFREIISPLDDAEKGRLFDAMLLYANDGTEPVFSGNERFIWPAARQSIDRAAEKVEILRQNGLKPKSKDKQNEAKPPKLKECAGWISCAERMPEKSGEYLCWFGANKVAIGPAIVTYVDEWKAFGRLQSLEKYSNITHWMPLPEPPEVGV